MIPPRTRRQRLSFFRRPTTRQKPAVSTPASLRFEKLEERLALSIGGTCGELPALDAFALPARDEMPLATYAEAFSGDGDSMDAAIDLGVLGGTRTISDAVGGADRCDYYRFELAAAADVQVSLAGLAQDIDLYLFDAAGRQLGQSIRPAAQAESIARTLGAGAYYVSVTPFGNKTSAYQLTLAAAGSGTAPSDGAGNSFGEARELGSLEAPKTFDDRVGREDPADYYRFQLDREGAVEIRLAGLQADLDLYLFGEDGRELARSWNGGTSAESIRLSLSAGEYVVLVKPWGGADSAYRLSMQAELVEPAPQPAPQPTPQPAPQPAPDPTPEPSPDPGAGGPEPFPDVDDFGGANDWNLNRVGAPEVWAQGITGEGVVVAVVDTGVDFSHRELASQIWVNPGEIPHNGVDDDGNGFVDDAGGWDFVQGDGDPSDQNGHGTHVAGIIAAANDGFGSTGVAHGSTIMVVRVLDADGMGSISDVAAGIRYAVDNGADVINLSLGGDYSSTLRSALVYAGQNGILVVAAAGNEAAAAPAYPAAFSAELTNVLSVGAHDSDDARASFSNGASGAVQVDAPGVSIYSTLPGNRYGRFSGTSMAAPHVAGLAALALSADPGLNPQTLRSLIVDGADRAIAGSDSAGGANAALSTAMAAAYTSAAQVGSSTPQRETAVTLAFLYGQLGETAQESPRPRSGGAGIRAAAARPQAGIELAIDDLLADPDDSSDATRGLPLFAGLSDLALA